LAETYASFSIDYSLYQRCPWFGKLTTASPSLVSVIILASENGQRAMYSMSRWHSAVVPGVYPH
jgi:hypothetical protein